MLTRLIEWTEEVQEKVEKDNKVNLQEFTFKKSHIPTWMSDGSIVAKK